MKIFQFISEINVNKINTGRNRRTIYQNKRLTLFFKKSLCLTKSSFWEKNFHFHIAIFQDFQST